MLLKKEKTAQIDPLENWPEHYYEIENAKERKRDSRSGDQPGAGSSK